MIDNTKHRLPTWAHRVSKDKIEQLYHSCSQVIFDHERIDEVGYALYTRCQSMLSDSH